MKRFGFIYFTVFFCFFAVNAFCGQEQISEKIVVTSTMTEKNLKDAPGSVNIVTSDEIKAIGASNLFEAIEDLPGLEITTGDGRTKSPDIRGTGIKHTLILIDGRRLAQGFRDLVDLKNIPSEMIERIEVIKGASSALYGSDAMGGVINVITKKSLKEFGAGIQTEYSQDTYKDGHNTKYSGFVSDTINRAGYFITGSFERKNGYEHDNISPDDGDHLHEGTLNTKFNFDFNENSKINAGFFYFKNEEEGIRDFQKVDRSRTSENERKDFFADLSFNNRKNLNFDFRVNHSEYENDIEFDPEPDEEFYTLTSTLDEAAAKVSLTHLKNHIITIGLDLRQEEREEETVRKDDARNFGSFIQDEYFLSDSLYFVYGIRYDNHSEADDFFAPKVSGVYKPFENLRFKASFGRGMRAPYLSELFTTSFKQRGKLVYEPNKNLDPEESTSYEFGIEGEYKRVEAKITCFRNEIDDLIYAKYYKTEGSGKKKIDYYKYENYEKAEIEGFETEFLLKLGFGFNANAAFTYTDNKDLNSADSIKGQFKLSQNLKRFGLSWNIRANYKGEVKDDSGEELDDYVLYHFNIRKKLGSNLDIFAGSNNIFNKKTDDYNLDPATYYCGLSIEY
ncbi:MAG: TonB-dependent receptor [Desulfobacteraceae bacterium]|nr:TonB-dependent receptor [Desulfobacteraceae bacterium]